MGDQNSIVSRRKKKTACDELIAEIPALALLLAIAIACLFLWRWEGGEGQGGMCDTVDTIRRRWVDSLSVITRRVVRSRDFGPTCQLVWWVDAFCT